MPVVTYFLGLLSLMSVIGLLIWAVEAFLAHEVLSALLGLLGAAVALWAGARLLSTATRGKAT